MKPSHRNRETQDSLFENIGPACLISSGNSDNPSTYAFGPVRYATTIQSPSDSGIPIRSAGT
jgi:hypothetical protein